MYHNISLKYFDILALSHITINLNNLEFNYTYRIGINDIVKKIKKYYRYRLLSQYNNIYQINYVIYLCSLYKLCR